MPCYDPLVAIDLGYTEGWKKVKNKDTGKVEVKDVIKHNIKVFSKERAMAMMKLEHEVRSYYDVPCGHCIGCRSDQSLEWSNRLLMESLYHDNVHFLTLTYCDEYIRMVPSVDLDTGEFKFKPTLYKPDWQNFMKRLREKFKSNKLRFYCCGEYGDNTDRPHYHAIIFGLPSDEMTLISCGKSETGQPYFRSPELEDCWKATDKSDFPLNQNHTAMERGLDPSLLGFISIEPANFFTMKYVTAYVTKKIGASPNQRYLNEGRQPPFSLSSRNPGIGLWYLEDHPECMEANNIIIGTETGKSEFKPPRYFKKKYAKIDPGLIDEIAEKNKKKAEDRINAELSKTDIDKYEYLKIKEQNHLSRIKNRNKI